MSANSGCSANTITTGHRWRGRWLLPLAALSALSCGCPKTNDGTKTHPNGPKSPVPLRLVVVDDPRLADAVEREWRARAEGEIRVRQMATDEILKDSDRRLAADAVIYPVGLIGELATRDLIVPIADDVVNDRTSGNGKTNRPRFARRDIFELVRQQDIVWGERVYAVPLGSPAFVLFYRRDLLDSLDERPPTSWSEYQRLALRLSDRENLGESAPPEGVPWYGVTEPLGPGWAGQTLLARSGGYARHRNFLSALFDLDTMEPLIATPPFVRALEELVAAAQLGPTEAVGYSPSDVRRELLAGHCAMTLAWPSRAEVDGAEVRPETRGSLPIGVAELPASSQVYEPSDAEWQKREDPEAGHVTLTGIAGRLGSVTKSSRRPQAATDLLLRLSGTDWGTAISPQSPGTTLYRTSQMQSAGSWIDEDFEPAMAGDYAEVVKQAHRRPLHLCSPRIPGRPRYLAALDEAVQQAIQRDQTPTECLEAAAERWRTITDDLGVESQKAAYWKSLGIEP